MLVTERVYNSAYGNIAYFIVQYLSFECFNDELKARRFHSLDAFLDHVIAILGKKTGLSLCISLKKNSFTHYMKDT